MSDVMSRLIARASGAVSAVEPVLSSRFEPAAPLAELPVVADAGNRAARESASSTPRSEDAVREPIVEAHADHLAIAPPSEKTVRQTTVDKPHQAAASKSPAQAPAPIVPLQVASVPTIRTESLQPAIRTESLEPAADPAREIPPFEVRVQITEPEGEHAEAEERSAHHPGPIRTNRIAERPSSPASPRMGAEPVHPVDVQVTIGHVELRMVQPPARPAPARRPATPRVSLDDYLRRRNGETR